MRSMRREVSRRETPRPIEPTPAEARVLAAMEDPGRRGWTVERLARFAEASPADAASVYLRLGARIWSLPRTPEPARLRVILAPTVEPEIEERREEFKPARFVPDRDERNAWHAEMARRRDEGDPTARNQLVEANIPIARLIASQQAGADHERFEEFFSEACKGLIVAAEKFDPSRGKFSTCAFQWIMQAIRRYRANAMTTVRVPVYLNGDPAKIKTKHLEAAAKARSCSGLGWAGAEGVSPLDMIVCHRTTGETAGFDEETAEILARSLESLPDREREVIGLRFGLGGDEPLTLKEIGARLGLCKERVRQVERDALESIRSVMVGRGLE